MQFLVRISQFEHFLGFFVFIYLTNKKSGHFDVFWHFRWFMPALWALRAHTPLSLIEYRFDVLRFWRGDKVNWASQARQARISIMVLILRIIPTRRPNVHTASDSEVSREIKTLARYKETLNTNIYIGYPHSPARRHTHPRPHMFLLWWVGVKSGLHKLQCRCWSGGKGLHTHRYT